MNHAAIRAGAVVDHCVLNKEIEIGVDATIGVSDDNTPNALEPDNINTGITIVGKRAHVPAGAIIGRNCRVDAGVTPADFEQLKVSSGATICEMAPASNDRTALPQA